MRTTYFLTLEEGQWSVFVRDREVLHLHSGLPDEPAAMKHALQHAKATGRHFDMGVYRIEPDGHTTSLFESHMMP